VGEVLNLSNVLGKRAAREKISSLLLKKVLIERHKASRNRGLVQGRKWFGKSQTREWEENEGTSKKGVNQERRRVRSTEIQAGVPGRVTSWRYPQRNRDSPLPVQLWQGKQDGGEGVHGMIVVGKPKVAPRTELKDK